MKRFKKKTLALVLASVITVAGSFASDMYKNSLTGIKFESNTNGEVSMVVQTREAFSGSVAPLRRDANTYIITLPETNSISEPPDITSVLGIVSDVNIRTMPYSKTTKGYTRITIKLNKPEVKLLTSNQVYLPDNSNKDNANDTKKLSGEIKNSSTDLKNAYETKKKIIKESNISSNEIEEIDSELEMEDEESESLEISSSTTKEKVETYQDNSMHAVANQPTKQSDGFIAFLVGLLITLSCVFFYIRANNKMKELVGLSNEDDMEDKSMVEVGRKIKKTIKTLDSTYSPNNAKSPSKVYNISKPEKIKVVESENIIDLDTLFKEQKNQESTIIIDEEEENAALEDFLSGFSFNEDSFEENSPSIETLEKENNMGYDEKLYNKIVGNNNLLFTKKEMFCINKILNNEILDNTLENIDNYAVTSPISPAKKKQQLMEELITSYTINQNIVFNDKDVKILDKLMSVELDIDFITDLRTNRRRTIEMETEILLDSKELKKPSEIKTLKVEDELPDMSDAVKKQGNKQIISNYKPDAIYFNDCNVKKLSVSDELQNLVLDIYKDDLFKYKPSASFNLVDENFEIGTNDIKLTSKTLSNKKDTNLSIKKQEQKTVAARRSQIKQEIVEKPKENYKKCSFEGNEYLIISSVELTQNKGCCLVKRESGYMILSYIDNVYSKLKDYDELKSEKLQARKQEELPDGTVRYIIRIGINKFVISVKDNEIEYVMNLC